MYKSLVDVATGMQYLHNLGIVHGVPLIPCPIASLKFAPFLASFRRCLMALPAGHAAMPQDC